MAKGQFGKKRTENVIRRTFKEFNSKEGTKESSQKYLDIYDSSKNYESIKKSFSKSDTFYVAEEKRKIIGVVRGKNLGNGSFKLINLFVDGKYHKKGIATYLVNKFENSVKKKGGKIIKLNASMFAINFYLKKGYKKSTGVRNHKGAKIQPMKKELK